MNEHGMKIQFWYDLVDISVAVATDQGLYTPIIKSACKKSISDISENEEFVLKLKTIS